MKILGAKMWVVEEEFIDLFEVTRVDKVSEFRSSEVKGGWHGVDSEGVIGIFQKFGEGQKRGREELLGPAPVPNQSLYPPSHRGFHR